MNHEEERRTFVLTELKRVRIGKSKRDEITFKEWEFIAFLRGLLGGFKPKREYRNERDN